MTLFTLLAGSHDLHVLEAGTHLCPDTLCQGQVHEGSAPRRLASLIKDVAIVYLHVLLPSRMAGNLPPLNRSWNDFGVRAADGEDTARQGVVDFYRAFASAAETNRSRVFQQFIDGINPSSAKPAFHYLHSMITHLPWRRLPSGKIYDYGVRFDGLLPDERWTDDAGLVTESYHRHLLQVAFADRLLGNLLDRLTALHLYDDALIIVTADHGSSFRPGDRRRDLTPTNLAEILPVPLLIKRPGQHTGAIVDAPAETIDILPTVADVVGTALPPQVDGRSLFQPSRPRDRTAFGDEFHPFKIPASDVRLAAEPLARKLSLFPPAGSSDRPWPGPMAHLDRRSLSSLEVGHTDGVTVQLEDEVLFARVDQSSDFLPAYVRGTIRGKIPVPAPGGVAIAVNGVIHATARTIAEGGTLRFAALVSERALRPGKNIVDILLLASEGSNVALRKIAREGGFLYELQASGQRETIVDGAGRRYPIASDAVQGYIDRWERNGRLGRATGWAADVKSSRPADTVVVFVNGQVAGAAQMTMDRPDVADRYLRPGLRRSGFAVNVQPPSGADLDKLETRVFAISDSGIGTELSSGDGSFGRRASSGQNQGSPIEFGAGFLSEERGQDGSTWRWMGSEGVVRLRNTHRDMRLAITGRVPVELVRPPTISFEFNGAPLDQIAGARGEVQKTLEVPASKQGGGDWCTLRITTSDTVVPHLINPRSPDPRTLGFAVYHVSWEPK